MSLFTGEELLIGIGYKCYVLFFEPNCLLHAPKNEFDGSSFRQYPENPQRVTNIVQRLKDENIEVYSSKTFAKDEAKVIHDDGYVNFLLDLPAFFTQYPEVEEISPTAFNFSGTLNETSSVHAKLGHYLFDPATPIMKDTITAAFASMSCALTALDEVLIGRESKSFALCRPPGHHASAAKGGGYCFLNNAAIVAQKAVKKGKTVTILDLDYHHGNGTQEIFYDTDKVQYISIHADPGVNYPFYWGFVEEQGEDNGLGFTKNLPVPQLTGERDYLRKLEAALVHLVEYDPDITVLSMGFDTLQSDPIAGMRLSTHTFEKIGQALHGIDKLVGILEGGYSIGDLGEAFMSLYNGLF